MNRDIKETIHYLTILKQNCGVMQPEIRASIKHSIELLKAIGKLDMD